MSIGSIKSPQDLCIIVTCVVGMTCIALYVRAIQLRKPGVPLLSDWWLSPASHLFYPERFTARGLRVRRLFLFSLAALLACFIVDHLVL